MIVKEFKKKGPVYKVQTFGTLQRDRPFEMFITNNNS